jgi:hypothetical protein
VAVRTIAGAVEEHHNLRAFNAVPGLFERAMQAQKHPGTWVEMSPADPPQG